MIHPLLEKRYLFFYIGGFIFFVALQSLILITVRNVDIATSISISFSHNLTYALLGTSVWFVIKYIHNERNKFSKIIFTHLATCFTVISLSIFIDELLVKLISSIFGFATFVNDLLFMQIAGGVFYYMMIILFYYLIRTLLENKEKTQNETRLRSLLKESELNALKSQINPHFLFNSLNSISSLTITDPDKAQEMLVKLSEYLRYSLKQKDNKPVALPEELDNCNKYLEIEKIRFGEKLITIFDIQPLCMEQTLPVLILQPLYENAVKHGVYESMEPVTIETIAIIENGLMKISIKNNFDITAIPRKGEGIGISNVINRLRLIYNNKALLTTNKCEGSFVASLHIPLKN